MWDLFHLLTSNPALPGFNWRFKMEKNNKLCRLSKGKHLPCEKNKLLSFFFNCQCLFWKIQGYLPPVFLPLQCSTWKSFKRFTSIQKYGLHTCFLPEISPWEKWRAPKTVTSTNADVQVQGGQVWPRCIVSAAPHQRICNSLKASQPSVIVNKQHPWIQNDDILQSTYWSWKAPASLLFSRTVLCVHL